MEKINGKSARIIQVQVTADDYDVLYRAAQRLSLGTSTYVRMKALEAARDGT